MSGGLLRRRGFDIWLRGAQKNGLLCARPGRGGAGRASPAETRVPDGAGGAGRRSSRGRTVGARGPRSPAGPGGTLTGMLRMQGRCAGEEVKGRGGCM